MKNKLLKSVLISLSLLMLASAASAQHVVLYLNSLWCDKTTEAGEDEVYFVTIFKYNIQNGNHGQYTQGPWNINDGKQPRSIGGINLFDGVVYPNTSVDITILIMEQDGGGSAQVIDRANQILQVAAPVACEAFPPSCPYASAIAGIVQFAASLPDFLKGIIQDTDDYIGSVTVRLSADATGMLSAYYYGYDRCYFSGPAQGVPIPNLTLVAAFNGDGSAYTLNTTASYIP